MQSLLPPVGQFTQDFVREGLITKEQLAVAIVSQKNLGEDLGAILIKKGFVDEQQLLQFVSRKLKIPYVSLKKHSFDPKLLREISATVAHRYLAIPLRKNGDKIEVAMANPFNSFALDDLREAFKQEIIPCLCSPSEIQNAIGQAYATPPTPEEESEQRMEVESVRDISSWNAEDFKKIQEIASGPKIIATVNELIYKAWESGASDIHIEPFKDANRIRVRVDGILHERTVLSTNIHLAIVSRIKIISGLDIAEHRVPQDGRMRMRLMGRSLDVRVSTCPTQYGEKVVLRLLAKEALRTIEDLGLANGDRQLFSELVSKNHGIFLTCGPTGSGKSTTLYAALTRINSPEQNIISIEDPIESEIGGIAQIAVNIKAGLTFASILRSVLRQDPDIIMIGEIRDAETASIAVRAAITGHMVLSTLHTNTAAGAISRLMDLGVEPFLLSTALQGVLAQRLVRKICTHCKEELPMDSAKMGAYARLVRKAFRGKGCNHCHLSGYSGRIGIFELASVTDSIRQHIYQKASDLEIDKDLRQMNRPTLREDGFAKVEQGITTMEEVLRVTEED